MPVDRLPKTAAEVHPVREVLLVGEADLEPFAKLLASEGLRPAEFSRRARLLISTTDTKFYGVRFREFSVSVVVENDAADANGLTSVFLIQAINTVRFFAWVERRVFSTPYAHARIAMSSAPSAFANVDKQGTPLVRMRMDSVDRKPLRQGEEHLDCQVYLPTKPGRDPQQHGTLFFATLTGTAAVYAPSPEDEVTFHSHGEFPVLQQLIDANCRPVEWLLRDFGRHKKTKTVARDWS
ncbi:MAG: hypothetical protein MPJ50_05285 [Pirellulales bacterium]|nr:hypothetical protein [Pirellulales bacterium]